MSSLFYDTLWINIAFMTASVAIFCIPICKSLRREYGEFGATWPQFPGGITFTMEQYRKIRKLKNKPATLKKETPNEGIFGDIDNIVDVNEQQEVENTPDLKEDGNSEVQAVVER